MCVYIYIYINIYIYIYICIESEREREIDMYVYIFWKASGGPWRSLWVPFRGSWEGESPRGGETLILEEGPCSDRIHFLLILATIWTFKNRVEKAVPKIEPKSSPQEAQGRLRGGSYRFWYHFSSHLNPCLEAHGLLKNSWKCVTIITFKGLAPSRQDSFSRPFPGLPFFTLFSFLGTSLLHFGSPGLEKMRKWDPKKSPQII